MMKDQAKTGDKFAAGLAVQATVGAGPEDFMALLGKFKWEHRDRDGNLLGEGTFKNTVTTAGKNDMLNKYFGGSAYTQTLRMGLKGAGSVAAGDTQASHSGWSEQGLANAPAYSGNRPSVTMGAAAAGSSVSGNVVFIFTSGGTVAGAFINNGGSATKDDTTGTLYAAGDMSGGNRTVANGDTLTLTYTGTLT